MQGVRDGPDDVVPDRQAELRGGSRRGRTTADRCVVPGDEARERPARRPPWARRLADKASDTTWRQPITNGSAGLGPFVDREIQRAVKAQRVDAATLRRFVDDPLIGEPTGCFLVLRLAPPPALGSTIATWVGSMEDVAVGVVALALHQVHRLPLALAPFSSSRLAVCSAVIASACARESGMRIGLPLALAPFQPIPTLAGCPAVIERVRPGT